MYIQNFCIKNYLIHQESDVNLSPLTVFVGPNGGGKSALFDALINFSMLARGSLRQAFGPYPFSFNATIHRATSPVSQIGYEITMSREKDDASSLTYIIDYRQISSADQAPSFAISMEKLVVQPAGSVLFDRQNADKFEISRSLDLKQDRSVLASLRQAQILGNPPPTDDLFEYCTKQVSRFLKFRLDPSALSHTSRIPDIEEATVEGRTTPRIGYHGEDLAATLYYLAETQSPLLDPIRKKIREIEPAFEDFEFNMIGTDRVGFSVRYTDSRGSVTAIRLSSGMLIFIGLMVLVMSPDRPSVLMIEEPENGLTPQAVTSFYAAVRDLALAEESGNRSQVMISSHSPFVICEAWNGEDRDFIHQVKVVNGKSQIRKFSDVIDEQGTQLGKVEGERSRLSLHNAEEIMSGYLS